MYRALIVEDDPDSANTLSSHLLRFGTETGETFAIKVLFSALEFLQVRPAADIIFMDIAMPGINGMEAAELLREYDPVTPLVFVTDLAQYAVRGYQVDALDFMVKPVGYEDFAVRMRRALRVMQRQSGATVTIPTADGIRIVDVADIVFVETYRHDLHYHIVGKKEDLRLRGSLTQVAEELQGQGFVRTSASFLANMRHIKLVRSDELVMDEGSRLPLSRTYKRGALETITRFAGRSI